MPKRKKKPSAICPSCGTASEKMDMKTALKMQEEVDRKQYKHYRALGIDSYPFFISNEFEWACDHCISRKNTEIANPFNQLGAFTQHLIYYDSPRVCETCNSDFVFTAQEKKRWYEQYQIWNFIQPKNCPSCRKDVRAYKNNNTRLSNLLQSGAEDLTSEEIREVIAIYEQWEKPDRVKYYESLLRKAEQRAKRQNDNQTTTGS
ncbi:zinc-ribbon domain containing protein [bacterium SCSIO 12741]|nr:zinc-ribbon domain containing protein [bacterium SCSIO 12741]